MDKVKISSEFDRTADYILFEGDCLDLLVQIPDGFVKVKKTIHPYQFPVELITTGDDYGQ